MACNVTLTPQHLPKAIAPQRGGWGGHSLIGISRPDAPGWGGISRPDAPGWGGISGPDAPGWGGIPGPDANGNSGWVDPKLVDRPCMAKSHELGSIGWQLIVNGSKPQHCLFLRAATWTAPQLPNNPILPVPAPDVRFGVVNRQGVK